MASSNPETLSADSGSQTTKVSLTGPEETLLATLYGRAQDAASENSVLADRWASEVMGKIDYDFSKTGMDATACTTVAIRAQALDKWTSDFLATHSSATVLHLGAGLDSRCFRVRHGAGVRWVDIDLPDAAALRRRLMPSPEGDYTLLSTSVADHHQWLPNVPADRPTIAIMEGLTMYLREEEGKRLLQSIVSRFAGVGGQLAFDCYGSLAIRLQGLMKPVQNTGSELHWGIDDPLVLEAWCPPLQLVDALRAVDLPGLAHLPLTARVQASVISYVPYLRDAGRLLRYQF